MLWTILSRIWIMMWPTRCASRNYCFVTYRMSKKQARWNNRIFSSLLKANYYRTAQHQLVRICTICLWESVFFYSWRHITFIVTSQVVTYHHIYSRIVTYIKHHITTFTDTWSPIKSNIIKYHYITTNKTLH